MLLDGEVEIFKRFLLNLEKFQDRLNKDEIGLLKDNFIEWDDSLVD